MSTDRAEFSENHCRASTFRRRPSNGPKAGHIRGFETCQCIFFSKKSEISFGKPFRADSKTTTSDGKYDKTGNGKCSPQHNIRTTQTFRLQSVQLESVRVVRRGPSLFVRGFDPARFRVTRQFLLIRYDFARFVLLLLFFAYTPFFIYNFFSLIITYKNVPHRH